MSKFKRYERYKDSGVEWIGEIPEHWEIKKIKYISNITMGQSPKSEECSLDETGLPFLQGNAEFTSLHPIPKIYCNTANKFSKVNDILLSVRAPVGAMNISDRVYGIGRGLCAITANKVQVRYLWYSMNVSLEELFIKSKGSTFEAVTVTDVNNLLSILPPKNEQIAIANFLDQKTAEIDGLIADKEKLIELLQEKRQAIITEAVTKGLNPNVRMKDSGIEWIGEIPEHWEVVKIKLLLKVKDGTHDTPDFVDKGEGTVPLITSKNIIDGEIDFLNAKHISREDYININRRSDVGKNDIIMPMIGTIGNPVIVKTDKEFSIKNVALFKTSYNELLAKFIYYTLQSNLIKIQFDLLNRGGVQAFVSLDVLRNLLVIKMPSTELKEIVLYLENKTQEIDSLILSIRVGINKLKEYRQSLISEAVTGKIDVRDYVVSN